MKRVGFMESNRSGSGFDALQAARKPGLHVTFFSCGFDRYHETPGGTEVPRTDQNASLKGLDGVWIDRAHPDLPRRRRRRMSSRIGPQN